MSASADERTSFLRALAGKASLGAESSAAIADLMRSRAFKEGEHLLRAGAKAERCFFVCRGLVREYFVGEAGEEHTRTFVAESQFTGSLLDLVSEAPAVTWIQALEPTAT